MAKKLFKKLDRRNTGFGEWKYYLNRPYDPTLGHFDSKQHFFKWRAWCWSTWGDSKELIEWMSDRHSVNKYMLPIIKDFASHNEHWCWQNDQYSCRIYLRSDIELSHFLLSWA